MIRNTQSMTTIATNAGIQYPTSSSTSVNRDAVSLACSHMISVNARAVTTTAATGRRTRTPMVCSANDPL